MLKRSLSRSILRGEAVARIFGFAGTVLESEFAMKTKKLEMLLGGANAGQLSCDATMGLNSLARRFAERSEEDVLFETAIRRANDEELRKLVRFRLNAEASQYLD